MPTSTLARKFRAYFAANFHSHDFGYVLYPFARILKIFGFVPVRLRRGEILRDRVEKLEWDVIAWIWSIATLAVYVVGFGFGVYHLSLNQHAERHDTSTAIAYCTSWAQIVTLFVLGAAALITAWTHLDEKRRLCALIFQIDRQLRLISDIQFDYKHLRRRLLIELLVEFMVAFPLSMVNCIIILPSLDKVSLRSSCFGFICFAPIMLIIFKEFLFYNSMFILKSKLALINGKLTTFTYGVSSRTRHQLEHKMRSVSEIPLTAVPPSTAGCVECMEKPNVATLQKLLQIYSNVCDGIELVLDIFSWHLLFLTAVSFGVITIQSYNLFALVMHSLEMQTYQVVFIIAWILVQIVAIGINVSVCSITGRTMSITVSLLHKMKAQCNSDPDACLFYQIVQLFSLEILQRKHNFTAAGFFDMNYKLITSIVGATTTYLVIIIQFHLTNIPDCHFSKHQLKLEH